MRGVIENNLLECDTNGENGDGDIHLCGTTTKTWLIINEKQITYMSAAAWFIFIPTRAQQYHHSIDRYIKVKHLSCVFDVNYYQIFCLYLYFFSISPPCIAKSTSDSSLQLLYKKHIAVVYTSFVQTVRNSFNFNRRILLIYSVALCKLSILHLFTL